MGYNHIVIITLLSYINKMALLKIHFQEVEILPKNEHKNQKMIITGFVVVVLVSQSIIIQQ